MLSAKAGAGPHRAASAVMPIIKSMSEVRRKSNPQNRLDPASRETLAGDMPPDSARAEAQIETSILNSCVNLSGSALSALRLKSKQNSSFSLPTASKMTQVGRPAEEVQKTKANGLPKAGRPPA